MSSNRFFKNFDFLLLGDILLLCALGFLMGATSTYQKGGMEVLLGKQFLAFLIGLFLMAILALLNYQVFEDQAPILFIFSISLLLLVLFFGKELRGAKAWFNVGPISFQPAEISKVITVLVLSAWCAKRDRSLENLKNLIVPFIIVGAHIFLILLQPDFGSTLVYLPILFGILFIAGAPVLFLAIFIFFSVVVGTVVFGHTLLSLSLYSQGGSSLSLFLYKSMTFGREFFILHCMIGVLIAVAAYLLKGFKFRIPLPFFIGLFLLFVLGWSTGTGMISMMKGYQQRRLLTFLSPELDPQGAGYHVIQSVIALGSGKFFGKGLFSGTQGRLGFLPEQHTDFIFSVLGEELGFLGSSLVLLLYILAFYRCFSIARDARDRFGTLVAVGIGMSFSFYALLNLAMSMGWAPVTGLPLPFLSYGGSSLISSFISVGILLSICIRRYTY